MPTVLKSLNTALQNAFAEDERVYLLGEDVLDPYGGAFKVSQGLSSAFEERVITTPISEAGIVGVAAGMAMRGLRPVVEIMFGDFLTLAVDQIVNHLSKFRWMYNDQVRVPVVIRTPMGGRRGYGPTHSQTLEKLVLGVPGLRVLAPCAFSVEGQLDAGGLLGHAVLEDDDPVLFVENKLLYLSHIQNSETSQDFSIETLPQAPSHAMGMPDPGYAPTYRLTIRGASPAVLTIAAYGYMSELAQQAALKLAYEREIFVEVLVPTQLAPFDMGPFLDEVRRTGSLLVVEEGTLTMGWGAEVAAIAAERLGSQLRSVRRLAALDLPVPAAGSLESAMLPGVDDIVQIAAEMV